MKTCTKCDQTKPIEEFHRKGRRRKAECRDCCKEYQANRVAKIQHHTPKVKRCSSCACTLPASDFAKDSYAPSGLQANCRKCSSGIYQARKNSITLEPVLMKRCPKCKLTLEAVRFASSPNSNDGLKAWCRECSSLHQIERIYGVTPDQYREMTKNGCQVCGSFDKLHVDHDHACCFGGSSKKICGKCVRGILCERCNHGLGNFRDSPETMIAAIAYLRNYAARLPIVTN